MCAQSYRAPACLLQQNSLCEQLWQLRYSYPPLLHGFVALRELRDAACLRGAHLLMPSIMLDAVQDDEDDPGSEMGQPLAMPEPEPEREPEPAMVSADNPLTLGLPSGADDVLQPPQMQEAPPELDLAASGRWPPRANRAGQQQSGQRVRVTVPDGAYPGCRLEVQLPNGATVSFMVPEGAEPGSIIQATVPPSSGSGSTAGAADASGAAASAVAPAMPAAPAAPTAPADAAPPQPMDLIDWEVFSTRRQHLGIGMSVIGAALLCISVLHFQEHEQLLLDHSPPRDMHCQCEGASSSTRSQYSDGRPDPGCDQACAQRELFLDTNLEAQVLIREGERLYWWGCVLCMGAGPMVLGVREFVRALIGSCCCCCIDMSTFLSQSETCSMLFIRILIMNWSVVFMTTNYDAQYWHVCVFCGAILHLVFSCTAYIMSRGQQDRPPLPLPRGTPGQAAGPRGAEASETAAESEVDPEDPQSGAPRASPSLLRCGKCAKIFGLPPDTPPDAAARCPHCSTVNRQPPTFSEKNTRLQERLRRLRHTLQRQRRSRHGSKLRLRITRENVLADSFSQLRGVEGELVQSLPLAVSFDGEEGLDQGGVTREWMFLLMQAVLDPQVALFSTSTENYVIRKNISGIWLLQMISEKYRAGRCIRSTLARKSTRSTWTILTFSGSCWLSVCATASRRPSRISRRMCTPLASQSLDGWGGSRAV